MRVQTPPCPSCGQSDIFDLDPSKVNRWQAGEHIQDVWPEMSPDQREQLITGFHGACWDAVFADEEE